jgi:hypothetical protein
MRRVLQVGLFTGLVAGVIRGASLTALGCLSRVFCVPSGAFVFRWWWGSLVSFMLRCWFRCSVPRATAATFIGLAPLFPPLFPFLCVQQPNSPSKPCRWGQLGGAGQRCCCCPRFVPPTRGAMPSPLPPPPLPPLPPLPRTHLWRPTTVVTIPNSPPPLLLVPMRMLMLRVRLRLMLGLMP